MSTLDPIGPEKSDNYQEPQYAGAPPERKGPGCLFWGCLISGILFVITVILIIALVFFVRGKIVDVLKEYTEPSAAELPEIQLAEEERQQVVDRWESFRESLDSEEPTELVLTSDEFNVVAQHMTPEAADHVYFTIEGDELKGQLSVPVGEFGKNFLKTDQLDNRFFNASGTFDVELRDGSFRLFLQSAEVKGEPIPEEALAQVKNQNLAENLADDPEKRELFSKFESIEVKDGKIIMTSKGAEPATEEEADTVIDGESEVAPVEATEEVIEPAAEPDSTEPSTESEAEPAAEPEPTEEPEAEAEPETESTPTEEPEPALSI